MIKLHQGVTLGIKYFYWTWSRTSKRNFEPVIEYFFNWHHIKHRTIKTKNDKEIPFGADRPKTEF